MNADVPPQAKPGNEAISHLVHVLLSGRSYDSVLGNGATYPMTTAPGSVDTPPSASHTDDQQQEEGKSGSLEASSSSAPPKPLPDSSAAPPDSPIVPNRTPESESFLPPYPKNIDPIPPELLPTIRALAKNHAVCDEWYSSPPGRGWADRLFAMTGSFLKVSSHHVDGHYVHMPSPGHDGDARHKTIFVAMDKLHGRPPNKAKETPKESRNPDATPSDWSWRVYSYLQYLDSFTLLFPHLAHSEHVKDVYCHISDLAKHAESGTLAAYSLVEPLLLPTQINGQVRLPNNQHPTNDKAPWPSPPVWEADRMILELYKALFGPKAIHRHSTLLVITYDESGGCHDRTSTPVQVSEDSSKKRRKKSLKGSVRVPTILVSPLISPGTFLKDPNGRYFDHSSVLSSIALRWRNPGSPKALKLPPRALTAPTIWSVINRTLTPQVKAEYDDLFASIVYPCEAQLSRLDESIQLDESRISSETCYTGISSSEVTNLAHLSPISLGAASYSPTVPGLASMLTASPVPFRKNGSIDQNMLLERVSEQTMSLDAERFADAMRSSYPKRRYELGLDVSRGGLLETNVIPSSRKSVKRALLVGPSYLQHNGTSMLNGPSNDVDLMHDLFLGLEFTDIEDLKGDSATKAAILSGLTKMVQKTGPNDILVFYFSGLGSRQFSLRSKHGVSAEIFIPHFKATVKKEQPHSKIFIRNADIEDILAHLHTNNGHTNNVTLIFECAHSADLVALAGIEKFHFHANSRLRSYELSLPAPKEESLQVRASKRQEENDDDLGYAYFGYGRIATSQASNRSTLLIPVPPNDNSQPPKSFLNRWTFRSRSGYVLLKACNPSSIAIEAAFKMGDSSQQRPEKVFGVFTFYLEKVLRKVLIAKNFDVNWRQIHRLVTEDIFNSGKSRQVPFLDGDPEHAPFSLHSLPFTISLQLTADKQGNDTVALDGGFLHGVTPSSLWIAKNNDERLSFRVTHSPCGRARISQDYEKHFHGLISVVRVISSKPILPAERTHAVCKEILAPHLPAFFVPKKLQDLFTSEGLGEGSPTAYRLIEEESKADVIISDDGSSVSISIPSLGRASMVPVAPLARYIELSQIGHFYRNLRMPTAHRGCVAMRKQLNFYLEIGDDGLSGPADQVYFVREGDPERHIILENLSASIWHLHLLIFQPDMVIGQRFPSSNNEDDTFVAARLPMLFRASEEGTLYDGHGNARFIVRAIVTSTKTSFDSMGTEDISMSCIDPKRIALCLDEVEHCSLHRNVENRGYAVVDKQVIVQPSNLISAIRNGLMHNSRWTAPFLVGNEAEARASFTKFVELRSSLIDSPSASHLSMASQFSNKRCYDWPITKLSTIVDDLESTMIVGNVPCHKVVLLTCYDTITNAFQALAGRDWIPFHIRSTGTKDWRDLDFDSFIEFMTSDSASSFTLVVNHNAAYAIKFILLKHGVRNATTERFPEWIEKIKKIIFVNSIHHQPTSFTYAGLISMLPHWRSVETLREVEDWLHEMKDLETRFFLLQSMELPNLKCYDLATTPPVSLFLSKESSYSPLAIQSLGFFDLSLCIPNSPAHQEIQRIVTKEVQHEARVVQNEAQQDIIRRDEAPADIWAI